MKFNRLVLVLEFLHAMQEIFLFDMSQLLHNIFSNLQFEHCKLPYELKKPRFSRFLDSWSRKLFDWSFDISLIKRKIWRNEFYNLNNKVYLKPFAEDSWTKTMANNKLIKIVFILLYLVNNWIQYFIILYSFMDEYIYMLYTLIFIAKCLWLNK